MEKPKENYGKSVEGPGKELKNLEEKIFIFALSCTKIILELFEEMKNKMRTPAV